MSSIMRWRNGLIALSVMAIAPVSHEVTNPIIFRQDEPSRYPDIQCASRTLSPGHLPRERFSPWVESGYPFKPPECRQRHKPTCKRRLPGLAIAMTDKAISPLRQR